MDLRSEERVVKAEGTAEARLCGRRRLSLLDREISAVNGREVGGKGGKGGRDQRDPQPLVLCPCGMAVLHKQPRFTIIPPLPTPGLDVDGLLSPLPIRVPGYDFGLAPCRRSQGGRLQKGDDPCPTMP